MVELPHGVRIHGTLAWLFWLGLHLFYLLGGRNRLSALLNLSYRFLVWGHGGGVIVGDDPPEALPGEPPQLLPDAAPGSRNRPGEGCLTSTYAPTRREAQHARVPDPPVRYLARGLAAARWCCAGCRPPRASSRPRGHEPGTPGAGSPDRAPAWQVAPGGSEELLPRSGLHVRLSF